MLSLCFDKCGSNLFVIFISHEFVLPKLINFYPSKKIPTYIVLAGSVHPSIPWVLSIRTYLSIHWSDWMHFGTNGSQGSYFVINSNL